MKIVLSGMLDTLNTKRQTATLTVRRRGKDAPQSDSVQLRFHSPEAFTAFASRHTKGTHLLLTGLLRLQQVPLLDPATRAPVTGSQGKEVTQPQLSLEVREARRVEWHDEGDLLYAHGLVSVVDTREGLRQSAAGLPYLRVRVAYNHFKRPHESEAQADFYDLVAFGGTAESLANLEKGERFLLEHAIPTTHSYALRDLSLADGSPVMRQGIELTLREFSYLPRPRARDARPESALPF
ncbi:MAG: hypothetical protein VKP62_02545 [Candidatus Sericytochromatia bacterium]|nr:hypothetical protein [Candidatus Sericytochromatia bacterium]